MGDATGALSIDGVEKCDEGAVRVLIFVLTLSFFDLGWQDGSGFGFGFGYFGFGFELIWEGCAAR